MRNKFYMNLIYFCTLFITEQCFFFFLYFGSYNLYIFWNIYNGRAIACLFYKDDELKKKIHIVLYVFKFYENLIVIRSNFYILFCTIYVQCVHFYFTMVQYFVHFFFFFFYKFLYYSNSNKTHQLFIK